MATLLPIDLSRRELLASVLASAVSGRRPPNIIVIVADDLGYGEPGCQGDLEIPTPHIDSIAANGVRFTVGYVTAPLCSPSRAGFMTGRYQTRFGHELNAIAEQNADPRIGLPLSEITIADALKKAGYATGAIGKWHLGGAPHFHPQRRGFDEFFGFTHEGHFFVPAPYTGLTSYLIPLVPPYDLGNPIYRGDTPVEEKAYLTEAFCREAVSFVDRHRQQPFFLYLAFNAVHHPMQSPPKYMARVAKIKDPLRRILGGMLVAMDDAVGELLEKLRAAGLEENTLIFFYSDNGAYALENATSNKPLRGFKSQLWEGGIRVPFLLQWKGKLPGGVTYSEPVSALDVFPTAVAAAGGRLPSDRILDGVNLLPYLEGRKTEPPHEQLYWRLQGNTALRCGKWKLIRQANPRQKGDFQLFDLEN
ncbi:MAG: sulfatase-like hydrolase/transferase, partial [Acidobacteria bacterium]|nr:sulfatase-like hydrolase/transferase [Acidobacteriota bacterium]